MKWLNKKHMMVDLETLATTCDAAILSIGACKFDFVGGGISDTFYLNVDPKSCKDVGMRIDKETIKWWTSQPEALKAFKNPTPVSIQNALVQFTEWFDSDYIWCQGQFDVPIIEYAYHKIGSKSPYKYWQAMDSRTAFTLLDVRNDKARDGAKDYHNALGDAVAQAKLLISLFEKEAF